MKLRTFIHLSDNFNNGAYFQALPVGKLLQEYIPFSFLKMLIACGPKKPQRMCENFFSSSMVPVSDIELDSLDGNSESTMVLGEKLEIENKSEIPEKIIGNKWIGSNVAVKHLNLNNLCKNQDGEINHCYVEEIVLPGESLQSLSDLQVLSLRANGIQSFPPTILQLTSLVTLDMTNNNLLTIPHEINQLISLKEFILDQNFLSILPDTLWDLEFLKILRVAFNKLALPPDRKIHSDMKSPISLVDSNNMGHERKHSNGKSSKNYSKNPNGLSNLNLRGNKLKGHIILGNYHCLTELDLSENSIEILDLGSVEQLQVLQCSRNQITQLTLFGKNLISVIAGNNKLNILTTAFPPAHLKHFDVSFNEMEKLPDWLAGCSELRTLFASNNFITSLPEHIFCNEMPFLQTVQLAYNHLQHLPQMQRRLPIQELFLQNNSLSSLPDNFFKCVRTIKVLNLSNNRLVDLPTPDEVLQLEKLYLTANCLVDKSLEKTSPYLRNIKTIHVAYNNLTAIPDNAPIFWSELEELVVSGNKIGHLPENIRDLKHLAVLRIHSNVLQNIPALSSLLKLRVLDLAHNQLDRIDLTHLIPPNLKFLDLSCNTKLHVDSQQFNTYRTQRPISLVDVSGKNRTTLPLAPGLSGNNDFEGTENHCWTVGFSETPGSKPKLHIVQVRLPTFCNAEALFGLFDGENNGDAPVGVDKMVPRILLEERTVKETAHDYIKFTMLSTYRHLQTKGVKQGLNAVIIHIFKLKPINDFSRFSETLQKHMMKISCIGDAKVVLGKSNGTVEILPPKQKHTKTNPPSQFTIPDPEVTEAYLGDQDEYLIIANKNLWDVMTPENAIKEVHQQKNVILAAKRLQDLAQSYGAEENLSIMVVKLNLSKAQNNVDLLMRELRQTIRQNKFQNLGNVTPTVMCQPGCCCGPPNNDCINCVEKIPIPPPMMIGDDRSSPSGQSDHACSDCNSYSASKVFIGQLTKQNDSRLFRSVTPSIFEPVDVKHSSERRSYRGVAKALRQKREEERNREDSDSAMSEEQFKCWEYMLEQNTQKLFDKELNTLNNKEGHQSFRKFSVRTPLSRSSPQLATVAADSNNNMNSPGGVFLSRQFGSSRSFNPTLSQSTSRLALEKIIQNRTHLLGGPNAAYFGSLQRLMPYNLEYDFSVMHERGLVDSLDLDRMQQYWGVATTEL